MPLTLRIKPMSRVGRVARNQHRVATTDTARGHLDGLVRALLRGDVAHIRGGRIIGAAAKGGAILPVGEAFDGVADRARDQQFDGQPGGGLSPSAPRLATGGFMASVTSNRSPSPFASSSGGATATFGLRPGLAFGDPA